MGQPRMVATEEFADELAIAPSQSIGVFGYWRNRVVTAKQAHQGASIPASRLGEKLHPDLPPRNPIDHSDPRTFLPGLTSTSRQREEAVLSKVHPEIVQEYRQH